MGDINHNGSSFFDDIFLNCYILVIISSNVSVVIITVFDIGILFCFNVISLM